MANEIALKKALEDEAFVKTLVEMETPEEVRDALNAKGAEVTVEDVQQLLKAVTAQAEGELDEDALEDVAGGTGLWDFLTSTVNVLGDVAKEVNRRGGRRW